MESVKLKEIVKEFILAKGEDSLHKFSIYLQHAIRGLKDINQDVSGVLKIAELELTNTNSAVMPDDLIKIAKIGISRGNNQMTEIYVDNTIIPNPEVTTGTGVAEGFIGSSINDISDMYKNGENVGGLFGNEGGSAYGYNINYASGTITVSSNVTSPLIVLYLANPQKVNGEYVVHPFLVEPIMRFIYYAEMRYKQNYSRGEKNEAHRDYVLAKHHANVQFKSRSIGEMRNASRKTFNQSIRY